MTAGADGTAAADVARAHEIAERAWGDAEPAPTVWSSGRWSLELRGSELADIRYDEALVLRSVRAVARDRDWDTVPTEVTDVRNTADGLALDLRMTGLGADIEGTLSLAAAADAATGQGDALGIRFSAVSHTGFLRNRLGLVVLHPPEAAGAPLEITSPDGDTTRASFPVEIAPHQPALNIAELAWPAGEVRVSLAFEGDVFEMEDQRNWTDASFKTYSTPLSLPFPVLVTAGEAVEQALTLRCDAAPGGTGDDPRDDRGDARPASLGRPPATLRLVPAGRVLPSLSVGASTAAGPRPARASSAGDSVLVELEAGTANWRAALDRAVEDAAGRPLDVRVVAATTEQLERVLDAIVDVPVIRLGVYSSETHVSEPDLWQALVAGASSRAIGAELVGGARAHFTELNRTHERLPADIPALTFSVTPQMHAHERAQLVESIAMQRLVAENAVRIAAGRPVHVGPVTLRSRFNAVATSAPAAGGADDVEGGYGAEHVPGATDPRQASPALAAWTIASAAALSVPGVASIAYFEAWGARGLRGTDGVEVPVAGAFDDLHALAGCPAFVADGDLPAGLWLIAAATGGPVVALLANLTAETITVTIEAHGARSESASVPAYGTARVTLGEARAA